MTAQVFRLLMKETTKLFPKRSGLMIGATSNELLAHFFYALGI